MESIRLAHKYAIPWGAMVMKREDNYELAEPLASRTRNMQLFTLSRSLVRHQCCTPPLEREGGKISGEHWCSVVVRSK